MTDSAINQPGVLYLEPDDEIPSVVRRLRDADADRVVLVAPGRTKATSSAIGLRLLARYAMAAGRNLALVAEQATRALANEAGIPAFATIAEAQADAADPVGSGEQARPRAKIHVVRGERAGLAALAAVSAGAGMPLAPLHAPGPVAPAAVTTRLDETQAVPVVSPPPKARVARPRARRAARVGGRATAIAVVATLVVAAGVVAAILPAATVTIMPAVTEVGPVRYSVELPSQEDSGKVTFTQTGKVNGTYTAKTPAKGIVTFFNYGGDPVEVPAGTGVSAGDQVFTTDARIVVPAAVLFAGKEAVAVTAATAGPDGNVAAHEIDTIQNKQLARRLRASPLIISRLVDNEDATAGGNVKTGAQVTQKDVDDLLAALKASLKDKLEATLSANTDRVYAPPASAQEAVVSVPKGLVGTKDKPSIELSGSLAYDQRYLTTGQLQQAGVERLTADTSARPTGSEVVASSVQVEATNVRASGDFVQADLSVRGGVTPPINKEQVKSKIAGMSREDAGRALAEWGTPSIRLWPSWVDAIPRLGFRVQIALEAPSASPAASPGSATATP
jgi:hypothetical protein